MSDLLKDRYSADYVARLGKAMAAAWPRFDAKGYRRAVLAEGWPDLELKQRMRRLSSTLHDFLPIPYVRQIAVLTKVAPRFGGFEGLFLPDFVEQFGLNDFQTSVRALERFTQFSSSEFAVRPFLVRYAVRMLDVMLGWALHDNHHVRRLASEGCRPRLPWAMALPQFKRDPAPVLPILEALRNDPSDYVRRSVANNLNDIAKDHPQIVLDITRRWLGQTRRTDALLKHACRTLLKRGDPQALGLFGFARPTAVKVMRLGFSSTRLRIGDDLTFAFEVVNRDAQPATLRLEYAVDFVKAAGHRTRKVFQVSEGVLAPQIARRFERRHRFRDFTTRKHHPGEHHLSILVNGEVAAQGRVYLERASRTTG